MELEDITPQTDDEATPPAGEQTTQAPETPALVKVNLGDSTIELPPDQAAIVKQYRPRLPPFADDLDPFVIRRQHQVLDV